MKIFIVFVICSISLFSYSQNGTTTQQEDKFIYKKEKVTASESGTLPLVGATKEPRKKSSLNRSDSGVGETMGQLSVSLSGSAQYDIPIAVPDGINGIVPEIAISYDSQSGNGIAGYGWTISGISSISLIPSTKYHDDNIDEVDYNIHDRYALDGQRLILKSGAYDTNGAKFETENYSNIEIEYHKPYTNTTAYFIVRYPDGSFAHYGDSSDSRTLTEFSITYWENPQGVRISYEYNEVNRTLSISKIKYGSLNTTTPINEIRFLYSNSSSSRGRWEQSYIGNASLVRNDILTTVESYSNNVRYRKYSIYHDETDLKYNRVTSVKEYSGDGTSSHSSIVFGYTDTTPLINYNEITTSIGLNNVEQRNAQTTSFDLTGSGKMDFIVYPNDKDKFWLFKDFEIGGNNVPWTATTGLFETIFPTTLINYQNKVLPGQGLTVVQHGAAGQVNFKVYANGVSANPITLQYTKSWTSNTFSTDDFCDSSINETIPKEYVSGDFNGDGLTDVLAVQKQYEVQDCEYGLCGKYDIVGPNGQCCNCNTTIAYPKKVYFVDLKQDITSNFVSHAGDLSISVSEDDILQTGDFNGDGKTDLYHISNGKIYIYTLDNNNNLSLLRDLHNSGFSTSDPPLFGDFNGDGKTDFLDPIANNSYDFNVFISTGYVYIDDIITQPFKYVQTNYNSTQATLYGYNLIPLDVNGDGRTDIVEYNTITYQSPSTGTQNIKVYNNEGLDGVALPTDIKFISAGTATKSGNLKHYPIPIFLTSTQPNKSLDFASISDQWVTKFSFTQDHREDVLMRSITSNGVAHNIEYSNLNPNEQNNSYVSVYKPSEDMLYPYSNINYAPGIKLVKMLERVSSGTTTLQQHYRYYGAVFNYEGLGFQGFEGVAMSNWHTNNMDRIYNISRFDPLLRGATTASYSQANFAIFDPVPTSGYIDKTTYVNSLTISPTKVFKSWVDSSLNQDNIHGTYTNSTFTYDAFLNVEQINTNYSGDGTSSVTRNYSNITGANYHIGRLDSQIQTNTIGSESFTSETQLIYTNHLVTEKKTKGNGTPFDSETYEYDTYGNITKKTITPYNTASRLIEFEYDTTGRFLTKSIDVEGLETLYQTNPNNGTLTSDTSPYGQTTNYDYDAWNRQIKITDYLGNEMDASYSEDSNNIYTVTSTGDDGSHMITTYDQLKRISKTQEKDVLGQWVSTSFLYDKFDRLWKASEPYIGGGPTQWNETLYDLYGRPITQNLYTGRTISITYNNLMTTVNDGVKTVTSTSNAMGNTTSVTDPGGTITYTYFGNGNMKTTNSNGVIVSNEQDGWGRKTKLIDPSAGTYEYEYYGFGEIKKEITPKGQTEYTYSTLGKLTEKDKVGDNTDVGIQYYYHPTNKLLSSIAMQSTDGNNANYTLTYDSTYNFRLEEISETNSHAQFTKEYTYDTFGRVETEEYNAKLLSNNKTSNKKTKNIYQNGALKTVRDFSSNNTIWDVSGVNARGQVTSVSMGTNLGVGNTYDNFGYLTNNTVFKDTGQQSVVLMQLTNSFDVQRGTLTSRSNTMFSWSETFGYDNLDRLITFDDNNGNNSNTYDTLGRITFNNTIGDYNYSGTSYQVSDVELNNQGDLYYQQNKLQQVTYNAFKKPFEINEDGKEKIRFQYNAFSGRSHMYYGDTESDFTQRNNRKHYSFDGSMEISFDDYTSTSTFVTYIGGDPYSTKAIWRSEQASTTSEGYYYLHRDYLGSINLITDENGNIEEKRHFDAWGNIVKLEDGNNVALDKLTFLDRGYTGHEHLSGVKLVHMNGRLYDPKLRRFLSPDNHIQNVGSTQNFNRYSYVLNNPLMYVDPTGETSEPPFGPWWQSGSGGLAGTARHFLEDIDFRPAREWVGRNVKSAVRDVSRVVREIGRGIRSLFGGGRDKIITMRNPINLNQDPLSGSSSNMATEFFGGSGSSGDLGISVKKGFINVMSFANGFRDGGFAGVASTWDFIKGLGTKQGWKDLGQGLMDFGHIASPMSPRGMMLKTQMGISVENYIDNIPSMTAYEIGHDVGYGVEKIGEAILISKGTSMVINGVRSIPMALYNSNRVGVGSRLFGIGREGLTHGTLNQGTIRAGWGYISGSHRHVFRIGIGHNPRFYTPTVVFGNQIHYHINVFGVPAGF